MSTPSKDAKPLALIVDDDAMMRLLIRQTLERAGFVCHEALDGTAVEIRHKDDSSLPENFPTANMLRETVYGVADAATLEQIGAELSKDREVKQGSDGVLRAVDDMGFALAFQRTVRRPLSLPGERINSPGAPVMRPVNELGADPDAVIKPRTLSNVVFSNIVASGGTLASSITGLKAHLARSISLRDIDITMAGGGEDHPIPVPEAEGDYPHAPMFGGFSASHLHGAENTPRPGVKAAGSAECAGCTTTRAIESCDHDRSGPGGYPQPRSRHGRVDPLRKHR